MGGFPHRPYAELILASASPRRRELLEQAGFACTVKATETDETAAPGGEDAISLAVRLAQSKAEAIDLAGISREQTPLVIGADTVVAAPNGELLGKPADDADAARMLRLLSGATHRVVTGVCVRGHERLEVAAALTYVTFHTLSEREISAYVASGEPMGKAGAYAIQGRAARWIPRIHGEYSNVVGLPLALLTSMLAGFGFGGEGSGTGR